MFTTKPQSIHPQSYMVDLMAYHLLILKKISIKYSKVSQKFIPSKTSHPAVHK